MAITLKKGLLGAEGNESLQQRLLKYLQQEHIHPAIILVGQAGSHISEIALGIAKYLLCESPANASFCDRCSRCTRITKGIHPDCLVFTDAEEELIKIETVRQLCQQMDLSAVEGKNKICIIHNAHRLNTAAANAFLKTLEEPGEGRHFILLTNQPNSLLPTILSRCIQFRLAPSADRGLSDEQFTNWEKLFDGYLSSRDLAEFVQGVESKEECDQFLRYLQHRLREKCISRPDSEDKLADIQQYEEVLKVERRLRSNANYALMVESLLRRNF